MFDLCLLIYTFFDNFLFQDKKIKILEEKVKIMQRAKGKVEKAKARKRSNTGKIKIKQ